MVCLVVTGITNACDVCGGGVNGSNLLLHPHLSASFLELSYHRQVYGAGSANGNSYRQIFDLLQLTGQYRAGRILLTAQIPYRFHRFGGEARAQDMQGPGDVRLLGQVPVWAHTAGGVSHRLLLGGGAKLASGAYRALSSQNVQNIGTGSGSMGYLLQGAYTGLFSKWMVIGTTLYQYNTTNTVRFRAGDTWTTAVMALYRMAGKDRQLIPHAGLVKEQYLPDVYYQRLQGHGGKVLLGSVGIDVSNAKITIGAAYQVPLVQSLPDLEAAPRATVRFAILFPQKQS